MRLNSALRGFGFSLIFAGTMLGCGNASYEVSPTDLPAVDSEAHLVAHQSDQVNGEQVPDLSDADVNRLSRKIIYQAEIRLIVEDLDASVARLTELLEVHQGYVASSSIDGDRGYERSSQWTLRVPVERFNLFRESVLGLGEIEQNSLNSEDVTGNYYDLKQRIENARQNEIRLLDHLKASTKNLDEILTVEKELDRVRGEIERMQGRLKLMEDLSAMTTVTVSMREEEEYTPTAPPTFASVVGDTFRSSSDALIEIGQGLVLLVVGLTPWLPLLIVMLIVARHFFRRINQEPANGVM